MNFFIFFPPEKYKKMNTFEFTSEEQRIIVACIEAYVNPSPLVKVANELSTTPSFNELYTCIAMANGMKRRRINLVLKNIK